MEKTVSLVIVEDCNLNCSYCYEHHKTNKLISVDLAKEILYKELTEDDEYDDVYIDFFGGEPFLAFNIIKELFDYIKAISTNKKYTIYSTTNGTLIHGSIQKWLKENKDDFVCGLSIDGNREMHNYNRSNSFDNIDLSFFYRMWPDQPVKMTITPKSLNTLADGVIYLHEEGFKVSCNLAYGYNWNDSNLEVVLKRELSKLIDYYLSHPDIEICTMLDHKIEYLTNSENEIYKKWCGVGTGMRVYSTDGELYPCQFFTPLSIGGELSKKAKSLNFCRDISLCEIDVQCQECVFLKICPTCMGHNYFVNENIYHKDLSMCQLTKIMFYATSYLKGELLVKNKLILENDELYNLINGIKIVQDHIN